MGNISIQLPFYFSKTGLLRRSLIVRLERFAKSAPRDVLLEQCLVLMLSKEF